MLSAPGRLCLACTLPCAAARRSHLTPVAAFGVINPGTPPDESYMSAADIVLSFEDTYANYGSAETPAWVASYAPSRFWHIVLSATQAEMETAVALARQRNAGLIYVTDQGPATAYQQLVTGAYWEAELAAVSSP